MVLITMMLAQAGLVSNAAENQGKYVPRTNTKSTVSSYMKSIRANQETGLIDPALMLKAQKEAQTSKRSTGDWKVMGPDNYGSLTRAMIFDENDPTNNTLMIGTMGGHVFTSVNGGITMKQTYDLNAMISCMIQVDGITFVGTGDGRYQYEKNGLIVLGYETGFVGNGIHKIDKDGNIVVLEKTVPSATNGLGWSFVNEMALLNDTKTILAATDGGVYASSDMGENWTLVIAGKASSVRSNSKHTLAVVDNNVYMIDGNLNAVENTELPVKDAFKIVALSQSDPDYIYVAYIEWKVSSGATTYSTGDILYSNDGGQSWNVALAATSMYDIFGSNGHIDNAIEVFPNNPRKVILGGSNSVWVLEDKTETGIYRPETVSSPGNEIASGTAYVHRGIQQFVFNPNNANVFFVGTEGGVFRGLYSQYTYNFSNCNRYFITEEQHTSVARMFGVGVGGKDNRVLGGGLDHGTILIEGDEELNNVETGRAIFPNYNPESNAAGENGHGVFNPNYAGGHAEISTINPDIMFVSATGGMTTPLYRTETSGEDYDMSNFYNADSTLSSVITNANAFRTPFAMYEDWNDQLSTETLMYIAKDTVKAGETVYVYSKIGERPIEVVLPNDMLPKDTLKGIKDYYTAMLVCAVEGNIYMTRNSHYFNQLSKWWKIGNIEGIPSAVAISKDGNTTIVGTIEGNLYRVSNLLNARSLNTACIDSTSCVVNFDVIDTTTFKNRAVTGISIVENKVVVSLGNYGNNDYVYLSTDNGNSFASIQGSLPKAPVYSCLIESAGNDIFVGTEYGIYSKRNGGEWTAEGSVKVPVTEIRQAIIANSNDIEHVIGYDNGDTTKPIIKHYEGVKNQGVLYASTYGCGIIKCNDYRVNGADLGVVENELGTSSLQMNVYPNPVRDIANVNISLTENATVSYQIYDISGRMVMSNVLGTYEQGENTVTINTENLTSGSYIISVKAGNKVSTSKIMVL